MYVHGTDNVFSMSKNILMKRNIIEIISPLSPQASGWWDSVAVVLVSKVEVELFVERIRFGCVVKT